MARVVVYTGDGSFIEGRSVPSVFVPDGSADSVPALTTSMATTTSQNRN